MKLTVIKKLMLFAMAIFSLHACMEDLDLANIDKELTVDQSLVLPLGEANLTLAEILEQINNDLIKTEGTDFFVNFEDTLEWKYRIFDMLGNSTPVQKEYNFASIVSASPIPAFTTFEVPYSDELIPLDINSNPEDMRIDEILANSAQLKIEINKTDLNINPNDITIYLQFSTSDLKLFNNQTVISHTPSSFDVAQNILLGKFSLFLKPNAKTLPVKIKLRINTGNKSVTILPSSKLSIKVNYNNIDYVVAYGHFNPALGLNGVIEQAEFNVEEVIPKGMIKPVNPQIFMKAISNIGVKLKVSLDYMRASRKGDSSFSPVSAIFPGAGGSDTESFFNIIYPAILNEEPVTSVFTTLDSNYGKINRFFDQDKYPNIIEYKYSVENVSTPTDKQFLTPDAMLKLAYRLKVPLNAKASGFFELNDTIQNIGENISAVLENDLIDTVKLVLFVKNGLPIKANFEIALLDANNQLIATDIKDTYDIDVNNVDASGKIDVSSIKEQKIIIEFSADQLKSLREAKHLTYKLTVTGAESKSINLQTTDSFGIRVGIWVKTKTTLQLGGNNN